MAHMKTLTINGETFMVVSPTPVASVKVLASAWVGNSSPYSQVVALEGVTPDTKVDIQLSDEQLAVFHNKDLAFTTSNKNGVVTVYAIGQKPVHDYTFQVTLAEVENNIGGELFGNTVGTPMPVADLAQTDSTKADFVKGKELFVKPSEVDAAVDKAVDAVIASGKVGGKSAYQYAVDGGYTGTEAEFTEMLVANSSGADRLLIFSEEINVVEPEMAVFKTSCRLIPDMWYTVSWKGKEYVCRCRGVDDMAWIGSSTEVLSDQTFPFVIYDDHVSGEYVICTNETGPLSITTGRESVYEIGEEYVTVFDWEAGAKNVYRPLYKGKAVFAKEQRYQTGVPNMNLSQLAVGETYRVFWRDKYYDCVLKTGSQTGEGTWYWLGDRLDGTGEPFYLHEWHFSTSPNATPICTVYRNDGVGLLPEETVEFTISHMESVTIGTFVKSVNGTQPDASGNVEIPLPEGGGAEPLIGTTAEITPYQVAEALTAGRPISITHSDPTYGAIVFGSFFWAKNFNGVMASGIGAYGNDYLVMELLGAVSGGGWSLLTTTVATADSIPAEGTFVKSVNGKAPDENGNVTITVPAMLTLRTIQLSSSNCTISGSTITFGSNIRPQVSNLFYQLGTTTAMLWVSITTSDLSLTIQGPGNYIHRSGTGVLGLQMPSGSTHIPIIISNSNLQCGNDSTLANAINNGQYVNITVYQMK